MKSQTSPRGPQPPGPRGVVPGGNKDDDMDHQLTQQRAIDALQRDLCAARADTLRAREERDKARGEHSRLSGLADGRGYQVEKLETVVDALLAACERLLSEADTGVYRLDDCPSTSATRNREARRHLDRFLTEHDDRDTYDAGSILRWLGY